MSHDPQKMDRRDFLKTTAVGLGATAVSSSMLNAEDKPADAAKVDEKKLDIRTKVPTMEYRRLGRTNYLCSRIVQGFAGGPAVSRQRLLSQGVNYWDTARGYGNSEVELKPFLADFRDKLWVTSKATGVAGYNKVDDEVRSIYITMIKTYLGDKFGELDTAYKQDNDKDLLRFHNAALAKERRPPAKSPTTGPPASGPSPNCTARSSTNRSAAWESRTWTAISCTASRFRGCGSAQK